MIRTYSINEQTLEADYAAPPFKRAESLEDAFNIINNAPIDWIAANVHPYVIFTKDDTERTYARKKALYILSTGKYPMTLCSAE